MFEVGSRVFMIVCMGLYTSGSSLMCSNDQERELRSVQRSRVLESHFGEMRQGLRGRVVFFVAVLLLLCCLILASSR